MEAGKSKKEWRKENKRRKVAALLEIAELNDKDRKPFEVMSQTNSKNEDSDSDLDSREPDSKKCKLSNRETQEDNQNEAECSQEGQLRPRLSEADLTELRGLLRKRRTELRSTPLLNLKMPSGVEADIDVPDTERVPIFFSDIQHLVLFSVLAQNSPYIPRWCTLQKCGHLSAVQILFIEGAGVSDYLQSQESLPSLSKLHFPFQLEVIMPTAYNGNLIEEFCSIPLSHNQRTNLVQAYGSLAAASKSNCEVLRVLRAFFPVNEQPPTVEENTSNTPPETKSDQAATSSKECDFPAKSLANYLPSTDKFPRTQLLLSAWQLVEEGYPVPLSAVLRKKFEDFVFTKSEYKEVNNFSPMYGVDCEMCITSIGKSECTRVSIVNEKLETVLDTLVMPDNKITNYLTRFSGITASLMKNVTTKLADVQKFIQETIEPDAILVGQSLNFDLCALKMMHPYCIDTSVIFNVTGDRYRKSKLSYLTEQFLKESIQLDKKGGHCSVEDSSAALKLVQLKLTQSIEFGDQVLASQACTDSSDKDVALKNFKQQEDTSSYATSFYSYASRMGKNASIMASPEILEKYVDYVPPRIASYEQVTEDGSSKIISADQSTETGRVTCVITPSHETVAEKVASKVEDNFLTIGHIQLTNQERNALSNGDPDILERLNSWIVSLERSPLNSLSIVLLCGREKSSNGVCFVKLHKINHGRLNFQPKNIES